MAQPILIASSAQPKILAHDPHVILIRDFEGPIFFSHFSILFVYCEDLFSLFQSHIKFNSEVQPCDCFWS